MRTSSSSTSSSTSSSIDEALIQLTQQQQQQQVSNANKLFNDEPLSIFHYSSLPAQANIENEQQQAVNDNISFLASMATASTSMQAEPTWQQSLTSTSLDSNINLKRKMRNMMQQQQPPQPSPMNSSQLSSGNNALTAQNLVQGLNELCYKGFDELNSLIQEQRWVRKFLIRGK